MGLNPEPMANLMLRKLPLLQTGLGTIAVMPLMRAKSSGSWAGAQKKPLILALEKRYSGIWITQFGLKVL